MPLQVSDPRVRLAKTAFVEYYHADLAKANQFLLDFGLKVVGKCQDGEKVFYAGYGVEPFCYIAVRSKDGTSYFGGAAYVVESREELETATRIKNASKISKLEAPGDGEIVTLTDPAGFSVYLVFGQQEKELEQPELEKLVVNFEDEKPRLGRFQRFKPGPAPVHRWGHYGLTYTEGQYQTMFDWYTTNLALTPSDIIYLEDKPVTAFFHVDRGLHYTDHHAFFFKGAKAGDAPSVAHAAFEVHDFEIQQLGHQFLADQGHSLCWGVGRHVLGSQIFDYWFDPHKFVVEHYADGDLVNSETKVSHIPAGKGNLAIWGPQVPDVF